ncbi:MAG: carotenoid 1,2-hydratase [candidate division KSB1 bacterium]|nr:carotenoid 1,2-hydratase [candidate division KSB1 bacterium]MDZ7273502.1 carotenoid 1,2-hydratase [candidate division KSB1 bacterium]MDZ7286907.1 carotenoid 1,2-hydratase [candidate division KSB1 bacterium]MDZ7299740.1 carotenoid 1,2-hydratase [candidate division KSB1 bacterium]MDZ7305679.1 carotenoid 1,2-hydratase [candidate division KSB1 bacterium]
MAKNICLTILGVLAWTVTLDSTARSTRPSSQQNPAAGAPFALALAPRAWQFPRDHGQHPEFRTEWWYFTGNLHSADGRAFGYHFTIFRNALTPVAANRPSAWAFRDAYVGHFALTDIARQRFHYDQRVARAALQLAGASQDSLQVFVGDWSAWQVRHHLHVRAASSFGSIAFRLEPTLPPVLQGNGGLSQKGPQPGEASFYYSLPMLHTEGRLTLGSDTLQVSGVSWMDHEFFTGVDASEVAGWDWFSLHLSDSTALMLYRLRRADGTLSRYSAGALIRSAGSVERIAFGEFQASPGGWWRSAKSDGDYPLAWRLRFQDYELTVTTPVAGQELDTRATTGVIYWEGYVEATGGRAGRPITGRGYLEMTGYVAAARPRL